MKVTRLSPKWDSDIQVRNEKETNPPQDSFIGTSGELYERYSFMCVETELLGMTKMFNLLINF